MAIARAEKQELAQREADRRADINDMHAIQDDQKAEAAEVARQQLAYKSKATNDMLAVKKEEAEEEQRRAADKLADADEIARIRAKEAADQYRDPMQASAFNTRMGKGVIQVSKRKERNSQSPARPRIPSKELAPTLQARRDASQPRPLPALKESFDDADEYAGESFV